MNSLFKRKKKGVLNVATDSLSNFAIAVFVFIIVVFATLKGATSIQNTIPRVTLQDNSTYSNMTQLLGAVGQFSEYADLIVIIGILAVVILLVSNAFTQSRRR